MLKAYRESIEAVEQNARNDVIAEYAKVNYTTLLRTCLPDSLIRK